MIRPGEAPADWYGREVLPRLTVEAVYGQSVEGLRRVTGAKWIKGRCPCTEGNPRKSLSFSISTDHLGWRCFRCGGSGSALSWLAQGFPGGQQSDGVRGEEFWRGLQAASAAAGVSFPGREAFRADPGPARQGRAYGPSAGPSTAGSGPAFTEAQGGAFVAHFRAVLEARERAGASEAPRPEARGSDSGASGAANGSRPATGLTGPSTGQSGEAGASGSTDRLRNAVLEAAMPTSGGPYLHRVRLVWPSLPGWGRRMTEDLRWVDEDGLKRLRLPGLKDPSGKGLLVFAMRPGPGPEGFQSRRVSGGRKVQARFPNRVQAVQCEALRVPAGRQLDKRYRRTFGAKAGALFVALNRPGGRIHVAEGELSALAVAVQVLARGEGGLVVSCGGAGGMKSAAGLLPAWPTDRRAVVIHADSDRPGREAARALRADLRASCPGRTVEAAGVDPDGQGFMGRPAGGAGPAVDTSGADAADRLEAEVRDWLELGEAVGLGPGRGPKQALEDAWKIVIDRLRTGRVQL